MNTNKPKTCFEKDKDAPQPRLALMLIRNRALVKNLIMLSWIQYMMQKLIQQKKGTSLRIHQQYQTLKVAFSKRSKSGNNPDHLEQVRHFILKNGFQEPMIITCDLQSGKAYVTKGNHRLWVAYKEGIEFVPCCVIPHWLPPNGSYKKLEIDLSTLKSNKKIILPEHLGLTVAQTGPKSI